MSVSQILTEVMNLFHALGLATFMQAMLVIVISLSLLSRLFKGE